jgi:hypothetical protein
VASKGHSITVVALIVAAVAIGIAAVVYLLDLHADRQAIITVTGPVRVYDRESPPGYSRGEDGVIEFLHQGDPARVLRIRQRDGVESIRIRLRDGREGYIFCCDNFEISR